MLDRVARSSADRPPGKLIQYFCILPQHSRPASSLTDQLTIHERQWAFCPHDARARDHVWEATGGLPLGEIATFAQRRATEPPPSPQEPTEATG